MTTFLKSILLCSIFATVVSCGNNEPKRQALPAEQLQPKKESAAEPSILINTFSSIPPDIDGCSCLFSNSREDFKNRIYIYADNYQDDSFININGAQTKFKRFETKQISETHTVKKFSNNNFELIIEMKQVGQLDETWQQEGTLKLIKKSGESITRNIYGECGC